jgi:hypothetical protein
MISTDRARRSWDEPGHDETQIKLKRSETGCEYRPLYFPSTFSQTSPRIAGSRGGR